MFFKNLKLFIKHNTFVFALMTVTLFFSTIIILFSYGVYVNNQYKINVEEGLEKSYFVNFYFDPFEEAGIDRSKYRKEPDFCVVEMRDLRDNFEKIIEPVKDSIEYVGIYAFADCDVPTGDDTTDKHKQVGLGIQCQYKNNSFIYDYEELLFGVNVENYIEGRWFEEDEVWNGDKVCFVSQQVYENVKSDTIRIANEDYKIIGYMLTDSMYSHYCTTNIIIPIKSLSDDIYPTGFYLTFTKPLLKSEYDELAKNCRDYLGYDVEVLDFYVVDIDEKAVMKTMMTSAILLGLISAITIAMIYRYLLISRRKMTVIYRICGASYLDTVRIYLEELVLNLTACMGLGCVVFSRIIEPMFNERYKWFDEIFSTGKCYELVFVYYIIIIITSVVFLLVSMKKTPIQLLKGNNY